MKLTHRPEIKGDRPTSIFPGLVLVAIATGLAVALSGQVNLSALVIAILLGVVIGNTRILSPSTQPGFRFAARRLLRLGVVLLGFRLSLSEVLALGGPGLVLVLAVVTATFFGTQWLGRVLGLSRGLSLLVATGFSICGASAIAAMEAVSGADEEDVAFSIGLVTLCGTLSILILPALRIPLGLAPTAFGQFVGASVHDVAQVVATAATAGGPALQAAVIVKLTRVVLLAPIVAGVEVARRRAVASSPPPVTARTKNPPILPLFVAGFLGAVVARTVGAVPSDWLDPLALGSELALAAALFGLGTGVAFKKLRAVGGRPLLLGLASWVVVASVSYVGVLIIHG